MTITASAAYQVDSLREALRYAQSEQVANHLQDHGSEGRCSQFDGVWEQWLVTRHGRVEFHEQGHRVAVTAALGSDTVERIRAWCAAAGWVSK